MLLFKKEECRRNVCILIKKLDGPSALCRIALFYYRFIFPNDLYVIVFTWVLLNVSPLPINAVNQCVCHVANSPKCCVKKRKPHRTKKQISTSHNHGYKVKVTTKIATEPFKYVTRQFILNMQIFVADYIHSLVNKLQRIYCNHIWQHNNLYLSLDQSFNAKIIKY
jgi:hypothetical protein